MFLNHVLIGNFELDLPTSDISDSADKTRNFYRMSAERFDKLLTEAISKEYKKCGNDQVDRVISN